MCVCVWSERLSEDWAGEQVRCPCRAALYACSLGIVPPNHDKGHPLAVPKQMNGSLYQPRPRQPLTPHLPLERQGPIGLLGGLGVGLALLGLGVQLWGRQGVNAGVCECVCVCVCARAKPGPGLGRVCTLSCVHSLLCTHAYEAMLLQQLLQHEGVAGRGGGRACMRNACTQ